MFVRRALFLLLGATVLGCATRTPEPDRGGRDEERRDPFEVWTPDAAVDVFVDGDGPARFEAAARLLAMGSSKAGPLLRRRLGATEDEQTRRRLLSLLDEMDELPSGMSDSDRVDLLFWTFRGDDADGTHAARRLARLRGASDGVRREIRRRAESVGGVDRALALYVLAWSAPASEAEETAELLQAATRDGDPSVRSAAEAGLRRLHSIETARETKGDER